MNQLLPVAALVLIVAQPDKPSPVAPSGGPTVLERLERVDAKMAAVRDIRADFEQRKKTAMLKKPLVSKGRLLSKGETVLWDTREPRRMSLLVTASEVRMFYPDDKLVEIYPLDARFKGAAGGPLPRLGTLRERFELAELDVKEFDVTGPTDGLLGLRLTPKSDELRRHIASVRVLIDERVPCATRVVITDPDGEQTEIRFSSVKINTGVADAELKLDLPEGVKVSRPIPDAGPEHVEPADHPAPRTK